MNAMNITIGALGVTLGIADDPLNLLLHALLSATVGSTASAVLTLWIHHAAGNAHLLQMSVAESGVDLAIKVIGKGVIRDQLRDLDAIDKVFVALCHQAIVLSLIKENSENIC
jgi:hypothetical protein